MRLLQKLTARPGDGAKAWSGEPAFWSLPSLLGTVNSDRERIEHDFAGYVLGAYQGSGVVFSTALARMYLFAQARFQFLNYRNGRPGRLFGSPELEILERPWPNGTTQDLLARMEQDVTNAGNSFLTLVDDEGRTGKRASGPSRRISRLRPDWVTIVKGSKSGHPLALDARVIAYSYQPPGVASHGRPEPVLLLPSEVSHYAPIPDPLASFRGMSWITPIVREIDSDVAATKHKLKFFENGATINHVAKLDASVTPAEFKEFVELFNAQHQGVDTAYKTLFLGGGADVTAVGADLKQLDFKATQGAGETRIAAAGGMHPVIVGLSEGLAGSSLNAGNFDAAVRLTADKTLRYLWGNAAASLERLVTMPDGARLAYDDRDIPFLRDDEGDVATIQAQQATTIRTYTDAGYTPLSVIDAVESGDLSRLIHSGLYSVQLQRPGPNDPTPTGDGAGPDPSTGGGSGGMTTGAAKQRDVAETLQKVYLAVDKVITSDEARAIANKAGADLRVPGPEFSPTPGVVPASTDQEG